MLHAAEQGERYTITPFQSVVVAKLTIWGNNATNGLAI